MNKSHVGGAIKSLDKAKTLSYVRNLSSRKQWKSQTQLSLFILWCYRHVQRHSKVRRVLRVLQHPLLVGGMPLFVTLPVNILCIIIPLYLHSSHPPTASRVPAPSYISIMSSTSTRVQLVFLAIDTSTILLCCSESLGLFFLWHLAIVHGMHGPGVCIFKPTHSPL